MKKTLIIIAVLMLTTLGVCVIVASRSADGPKAWFISALPGFEDSTVYAPGYSEEAYHSVAVGMTAQELIKALGPPFHIWPAPPCQRAVKTVNERALENRQST